MFASKFSGADKNKIKVPSGMQVVSIDDKEKSLSIDVKELSIHTEFKVIDPVSKKEEPVLNKKPFPMKGSISLFLDVNKSQVPS